MRSIFGVGIIAALLIGPSLTKAESVFVQYRGEVDLQSFDCSDVSRSSFINRVCYDRRLAYMLISLNQKFYHYCEIDPGTVKSLLAAPSMGAFYNSEIKGKYDCRTRHIPEYGAVKTSVAPAAQPACSLTLLGMCVSYYSAEEEAEREKIALLEAELTLRKHVYHSKGLLSVDHGIFTTTFSGPDVLITVDCSYDYGMQVNFEDETNSVFVRIGMDDRVCAGIANRLGSVASRLVGE